MSADIFLGVPFNIASYALLTHMIAQQCNMAVGDFVHTFGDLHIYNNLTEQVNLQLQRESFDLPKLILNKKPNIFDYTLEDFSLTYEGKTSDDPFEYECHPPIKGTVAV